jgi:hypothetical protein
MSVGVMEDYKLRDVCSPRLSLFSRHRSLKKHVTDSLVSSRTSVSRTDPGPRVCPFCPAGAVPRQTFIFSVSWERKQKEILL